MAGEACGPRTAGRARLQRRQERYADFNERTDKVAEYGLAALVGGIAAKKLGLLATLGVFLAKFWKIGALALVGLGAGARRLLGRKDSA
ncbi:MAG: DUF2167 domain-containing protein [Zoogloea sp.]|nr:DUF2167 domain-containing protein [Zoogloea sp.]